MYSRGGLIAIMVAQQLRNDPKTKTLTIECMALFDAVDRDIVNSGVEIPENVEHVYHAIRDDAVGSRPYFGHTGSKESKVGQLKNKIFFATHAGMGGMPWEGDHPTKVEYTKVERANFDPKQVLAKAIKSFTPGAISSSDTWCLNTSKDSFRPYLNTSEDSFIPLERTAKIVPTITKEMDKMMSTKVRNWMWGMTKRHGMISPLSLRQD